MGAPVEARVRARNSYLPSLDGWRAVAILAVCCAHDSVTHGFGVFSTERLHQVGWAGVDLFFAISGLLICSRLIEEEQMHGRISLRGFYIRRVFRILPPAYAFLLFTVALGLLAHVPSGLGATIASALMIRNYWGAFHPGPHQLATDHFWSLSVEEHFYLILPAVLVFVRRRILLLSIMAAAGYAWYFHWLRYGEVNNTLSSSRTDLRLQCLLVPAILALFLAKPEVRSAAVRWLRPWFWITLTLLVATLIHRLSVGEKVLVVGLIFPFLVASTMIHPESLACRILEWKPIRYIGRLSYGMYLWQQLFLIQRDSVHWPFSLMQTFPLNYLGVAACAVTSYYLLEKPCIRVGHRLAPPATPGRIDLSEKKQSVEVPRAAHAAAE